MNRLVLALLLSMMCFAGFSQKGVISGHVIEKESGEDVIGGNVFIDGTTIGSSTDVSGNFSFAVDPGSYTLVISYIGFQKLRVEGLAVKPGEEVKVEFKLDAEDKQLEEVVVTGAADKSSESFLLLERKNAVQFVQNIGAAELSVKGISNAEAAVTQITGVSKQEGVKNVFVRGLGDRYNSTSLNGLPLPSEDPQYKNITLDFFSSNIISSIDVNKTFGAPLYGDVGGANINIVSKTLFDNGFTASVSGGVNSQVSSGDFLKMDGTNFFGATNKNIPISNLSQYTFDNSFKPNLLSRPLINSSLSISGGNNFILGRNALRVFAVANISSDYQYRKGVARQINPDGGIGQDFDYKRSEQNTTQFGLASLVYDFGKNNSITYNTIYIHDNKQVVGDYTGFSINGNDNFTDPDAYKYFVRRQQQNDNGLMINQLLSDIQLNNKLTLKIGGSYNRATGDEPDRRTNSYLWEGDQYVVNTNSSSNNHRFYSYLEETDLAGSVQLNYKWKENSNNEVVIGYNVRNTERHFTYNQFVFDFEGPVPVSVDNPDALFNQQSINNGVFEMKAYRGSNSSALDLLYYNGNRTMNGLFANSTYDLTSRLTVNLGIRYEMLNQGVDWDVNTDKKNPNVPGDNSNVLDPTYFLPSINIKYSLNDTDILRLASSKSYTMPQFKEVAPFYYEDVNNSSFGNPYLRPAENFNVDLRYEHYFIDKGLVAITGFYKSVKNVINRVQVQSAANEMSYVNTGDGNAAGVEVEFRKELFKFKGASSAGIDFGLNVSYLYTQQDLVDVPWDKLTVLFTNKTSQFEGASPWLVASNLTFTREGANGMHITSTLVLNYFSDRIYSLGAPTGNNDIVENGIANLDFISRLGLTDRLTLSFYFKNLINPSFRQSKEISTGENVTISEFKKGIISSIGLTYKF